MNGNRYLLDTNAIIQLLKGNYELRDALAGAMYVSISVIAELEFLSFPLMSERDKALYNVLRSRIHVFDLDSNNALLRQYILEARKVGLKLPDAIIAGTARANDLSVLTADDHFKKLGKDWNVEFYHVEEKS